MSSSGSAVVAFNGTFSLNHVKTWRLDCDEMVESTSVIANLQEDLALADTWHSIGFSRTSLLPQIT